MNKEDAYHKIIGQRLWIDRAIRDCEYLQSNVKGIILNLESAKKDLLAVEEYLKKFQPKKEMEKDE